jgi:RNA polymerase sigma-70 factor (ECF subfamily)
VKHPRAQHHEPAAGAPHLDLDTLYRDHAQAVARWVRRLLGPWLDVEDAVHEVFLVARRRLHEFRSDARVTTWLYRIAERVARHHRRRERLRRWLRRGPCDEVTFATAGRPRLTPVEELERQESSATVYRVLDRLPEKYRTVLVLFELERASGEEIAELTATRVSTVWVRLHRARALFLDRLQRLERGGRLT